MFEDYVGQLQMATIATITIENEGREMSQKEVRAKLEPIQQVTSSSFAPLLADTYAPVLSRLDRNFQSDNSELYKILSSCLGLHEYGPRHNFLHAIGNPSSYYREPGSRAE